MLTAVRTDLQKLVGAATVVERGLGPVVAVVAESEEWIVFEHEVESVGAKPFEHATAGRYVPQAVGQTLIGYVHLSFETRAVPLVFLVGAPPHASHVMSQAVPQFDPEADPVTGLDFEAVAAIDWEETEHEFATKTVLVADQRTGSGQNR